MSNATKDQSAKILMLSGSLGAGGKERQLINLLKHLQHSGRYAVDLAVMNEGGVREQEASLYTGQIHYIHRLFSGDMVTAVIKLRHIIWQNNIKLIHSWGSGIWDLTGLIAAKLCGVPFLHGGIRSAPSSLKLGDHLSRLAATYADAVVANSYAGLNAFRLQKRPQARVIYNGVESTPFMGKCAPGAPNCLCMVSNFRLEKDHETLLLGLPEIRKAFLDLKLYLVGQDAGTLTAVRNLVQQLDLTEQVVIITDCLNPGSVMAQCQIGILSTFGEGFSNVILEFMALAKPVVATDVGGNPEIVVHGSTGYLVPERNPAELAQRVIELLNDPEKCKTMGMAGRKTVLEAFTVEKMGSAYEALYHQLLT
jgi:glycosyltransferase involved in cell wall biosynthesis